MNRLRFAVESNACRSASLIVQVLVDRSIRGYPNERHVK